MIVELISVGTEILMGNIVNTNAAYLAEKCAGLGLSCYHQDVVGDNRERLTKVIEQAMRRADILILSGGLGPTEDDLTKEVTAEAFGLPLVMDEHSRERITSYFHRIGRADITDNNWKQAMVPEGAIVVDNHNGTAPGIIVEKEGRRAILLPGPPNEIRPMFERDIEPYLSTLQPERIYSKMVKICGIGESWAEDRIRDLLDVQTNPTIAPYAKTGEVHLRVSARASDGGEAEHLMKPVVEELYQRFGEAIYTTSEATSLEEVVVQKLLDRHLTLTTAESCTGGLLAGRIVDVAGASKVFQEGFITYADQVKMRRIGVAAQTLQTYGAVSEQTAREMAEGAAREAGAEVALSVTGIAGPDGGTKEKPVGLVYIGCYLAGDTMVEECHFTGNRRKNRDNAVVRALTILYRQLSTRKTTR